MMSAIPTATSIVTDSPKRIIDSTAVSATPKAPQSPYATPSGIPALSVNDRRMKAYAYPIPTTA